MTSIVWGRDPQEAFEEPYEYEAQEQFCREASALLDAVYKALNGETHRYVRDDRSQAKAVWLLAVDALDTLRSALRALKRKEHRIAGKAFRDIMESMDLASLFSSDTTKSRRLLADWYTGKVIPHREYRDHVRASLGTETAQAMAKHYGSLSRFTHRSHGALMDGYSLGIGDRLVHDAYGELLGGDSESPSLLVLPTTIAYYYAILANMILEYVSELPPLGLITEEQARQGITSSFEPNVVPRRFLPRRWWHERLGPKTPDATPIKDEDRERKSHS